MDVKSGATLSDPVIVIEGDKITTVGPELNQNSRGSRAHRASRRHAAARPDRLSRSLNHRSDPVRSGRPSHLGSAQCWSERETPAQLSKQDSPLSPTSRLTDLRTLHFATPIMQAMCLALVCLSPDPLSITGGALGRRLSRSTVWLFQRRRCGWH